MRRRRRHSCREDDSGFSDHASALQTPPPAIFPRECYSSQSNEACQIGSTAAKAVADGAAAATVEGVPSGTAGWVSAATTGDAAGRPISVCGPSAAFTSLPSVSYRQAPLQPHRLHAPSVADCDKRARNRRSIRGAALKRAAAVSMGIFALFVACTASVMAQINGPPSGYWTLVTVTASTGTTTSMSSMSGSQTSMTMSSSSAATTSSTTTKATSSATTTTSSSTTTTASKSSSTSMTMSTSSMTTSTTKATSTTSMTSTMSKTMTTTGSTTVPTSSVVTTPASTTTKAATMTVTMPTTMTMSMATGVPNRYKCRIGAGGVVAPMTPASSSSTMKAATSSTMTGTATTKAGTTATGTVSTAKSTMSNGLFPDYAPDTPTLLKTLLTSIAALSTKTDFATVIAAAKTLNANIDTAALTKAIQGAATLTLTEATFTGLLTKIGVSQATITGNGGINSVISTLIADMSKPTVTEALTAVQASLTAWGVQLTNVVQIVTTLLQGLLGITM
ncbi:hypothetical protein DFJ73DRAFT_848325 [Zopfochytrium polystomum]|nr:hypothetical protein DFJ73DRAFT_848325 [Zopfochytrium polystomum]